MMTKKANPDDTGHSEKHIIQCGEVMDIASAAELKQSLVKALQSSQSIVLVAGQVERADTAALQLLSAFVHDATFRGVTVEWRDPSAALCQSAQLLGLLDELQLKTN